LSYQVCHAIEALSQRLVGKDVEELFKNMGKTWEFLVSDPQLRWLLPHPLFCASPAHGCDRIGPEKGVIHIATGAVDNALWDMYARSRNKPLWKLVVDLSPQELVDSAAWRYISDAITREEALEMVTKLAETKKEREATVTEIGYPAYVTSAGWMGMCLSAGTSDHIMLIQILGYSDDKIARLTKEAVAAGFHTFKMKVGADRDSDLRRGKIIRSIIDDPQYLPEGSKGISSHS
jgi:L-fuconate dehydratase